MSDTPPEEKAPHGFSAMDPAEAFRLRSKGGTVTALLQNNAHTHFTAATASEAGRLGAITRRKRGSTYRITDEQRRKGHATTAARRAAKKAAEANRGT